MQNWECGGKPVPPVKEEHECVWERMDKMVDAMRGIVLVMEEILEVAKIKEATLRKAVFF